MAWFWPNATLTARQPNGRLRRVKARRYTSWGWVWRCTRRNDPPDPFTKIMLRRSDMTVFYVVSFISLLISPREFWHFEGVSKEKAERGSGESERWRNLIFLPWSIFLLDEQILPYTRTADNYFLVVYIYEELRWQIYRVLSVAIKTILPYHLTPLTLTPDDRGF